MSELQYRLQEARGANDTGATDKAAVLELVACAGEKGAVHIA